METHTEGPYPSANDQKRPQLRFADPASSPRDLGAAPIIEREVGIPIAQVCNGAHYRTGKDEMEPTRPQTDIRNRGHGGRRTGGNCGSTSKSHADVDHRSALCHAFAGCADTINEAGMCRVVKAYAKIGLKPRLGILANS